MIIEFTNSKLEMHLIQNPDPLAHKKYLYPITSEDIYSFLGLMLLVGVFRSHRERLSNYYSEDPNIGRPIFSAASLEPDFK